MYHRRQDSQQVNRERIFQEKNHPSIFEQHPTNSIFLLGEHDAGKVEFAERVQCKPQQLDITRIIALSDRIHKHKNTNHKKIVTCGTCSSIATA